MISLNIRRAFFWRFSNCWSIIKIYVWCITSFATGKCFWTWTSFAYRIVGESWCNYCVWIWKKYIKEILNTKLLKKEITWLSTASVQCWLIHTLKGSSLSYSGLSQGGAHYPHPVLQAPPDFQTLRRPWYFAGNSNVEHQGLKSSALKNNTLYDKCKHNL